MKLVVIANINISDIIRLGDLMNFNEENIEYLSSNKIDTIHAKIYIPDQEDKINGIIQISHGMCEHIQKYHDVIEFLVNQNYIVSMNNHLGHGEFVEKESRGFFADKNGYQYLVEDVYQLTKITKERFPNLPYILLGHSMGSFIARCYMYQYGSYIDGYIIMGTGGPNKLVDTGIKLTDTVIARKGKMYRSKFLTNLVIGKFNEKFKPNVSKNDWLSSDPNMLPKYLEDELGDFIFTASGYRDLFYLQKNSNLIENIEKVPSKLPVFLISGDMDPVGDSGDGVLEVYHHFIQTGHERVSLKLYPYLRHEILNEVKKDEVYQDIMEWIQKIVKYNREK